MDPQQRAVAKEFDGYRKNYSQTVDKSLAIPGLSVDFVTKVKAAYLHDIVSKTFSGLTKLQVLDIGCGVGNFHSLLRGHYPELVGIDVSEECIKEARTINQGIRYDVYDGDRLPYGDGEIDVAFTICVMHHVPSANWPRFVAEMFRVLRPGGLGIVFEHNPLNPLTRRIVDRCPFDRDAVLLKGRKTQALFADAGYVSATLRYILSVPAKGGFLRGVDRLFSKIPLGAQYYVSGIKPKP